MSSRERIIDAAALVMREQGLARSTTRAIAQEAGYSEGMIYKHFESKEQLFLAVITERVSPFVVMMQDLPRRAGSKPLDEALLEVTRSALEFYGESYAMAASLFAEPRLLAHHREAMRARGAGPQKATEILMAYLDAERRLGTVRTDASIEAAALMLIGACHHRAFLSAFWGETMSSDERARLAEGIVQTLLQGVAPAHP